MSSQVRQVPFAWVQTFSDQDRWTLAGFLIVLSLLILGAIIKHIGDNSGWWPDPCCPCCTAVKERLRDRGLLARESPLFVAPETAVQSKVAPAPIKIGELADVADVIRYRKESKESAAKPGASKLGTAQDNSAAQRIRDFYEGRGPGSDGATAPSLRTEHDAEKGVHVRAAGPISPRLGQVSPAAGAAGRTAPVGGAGPISPRTPGGRKRLGVSAWADEGPISPNTAASRRPSMAGNDVLVSPSAAASKRPSSVDRDGPASPSAGTSRRPSIAAAGRDGPVIPSPAAGRRPSVAGKEGPLSPSASAIRRPSVADRSGPASPSLGGQKQQLPLASPLSPGAQQRRNRWKSDADNAGLASLLEEEVSKAPKGSAAPRTPVTPARTPVTGRRSAWIEPL